MKAILILSLIALSAFAKADVEFNFLACIKDGEKIVQDVEAFINDVKSKTKSISGLISDIQTIINEIPQFVNDCKISTQSEYFEYSATLPGDFAYCIKDIETLFQDAEKLVADAKAKDISSLINDVVTFYDEAKQTVTDCKEGSSAELKDLVDTLYGTEEGFNPLECIKDAIKVVQDVTNFINDVNAKKDISSILGDLQVAVGDIQQTLTECGAGDALDQVVEVTDIGSCLKDIQQAVQIAQTIEADIKNKDISSFINDAVSFVNIAK